MAQPKVEEAAPEYETAFQEAPVSDSGESICISWNSIWKAVPVELLKRSGASGNPPKGHFNLSKSAALEQLSQGAIKIPFGDLRVNAPSGAFANNDKNDQQLIILPLKEVLRSFRPQEYSCRAGQSRQEIPESIADLFGPRGQALSQVRILKKEDLRSSGTAPATQTEEAPAPSAKPQSSFQSRASAPPAPATAPAAPIAVSEGLRQVMLKNAAAATAGAQSKAAPPASAPRPTAAPSIPAGRPPSPVPQGAVPTKAPVPRPPPTSSPQPRPAPPTAAAGIASGKTIALPLSAISAQWPPIIRQEIAFLQLDDAECHIPMQAISENMKQGRASFTWEQIRCWLKPGPPEDFASTENQLVLEIPLQAAIPAFMQARTPTPARPAPATTARQQAAESLKAPIARAHKSVEPAIPQETEEAGEASEGRFRVPLDLVSADWPGAILHELEKFKVRDAALDIPVEILEQDLRAGKLEHCWIQVCSWIEGFPATADTSSLANTKLELPLQVVAPLYFKSRRGAGARKAYVPEGIPDLFSDKAKEEQELGASKVAESAPAAPAEADPETAASPPPAAEPGRQPRKPSGTNIAEIFGEPKKKSWTPNEIVHKTAALPGIKGALIALQDGLLVAACLPPTWKSETVSAFLPQMFGRMKQYSRELNVGDLSCLSFTVEQGTLYIFNAGLIYFAALGGKGEILPLAELNIIANELSRNTK